MKRCLKLKCTCVNTDRKDQLEKEMRKRIIERRGIEFKHGRAVGPWRQGGSPPPQKWEKQGTMGKKEDKLSW